MAEEWNGKPPADPYVPPSDEADAREPYSTYKGQETETQKPKTLGEYITFLSQEKPLGRLATGIPTFDQAMRGGFPVPRFVVVGGAPGAFKTSLAARWAHQWASAGVLVGIQAVDEGPEGCVDRFALYHGCKSDLLEDQAGQDDRPEWARLAAAVSTLPIVFDDGQMNFEAFAAHIRTLAGDAPAVVISDSLQTVPIEAAVGNETKRERVDRAVRVHKRASIDQRLLVVATCELSRAYYRSEALAKELNPLAAFKETGSIEYQAQTAIVLTSPKGHGDLVDVTVAKNRRFVRTPFRLQTHNDLSFHETDMPVEGGEETEVARVSAPLEKAKREILAVLKREPLRSKDEIYRRIHGTKSVKVEALKEHIDRRTVSFAGDAYRLGAEVAQ